MVDLRDALRPFVDEAAAGPRRPVAEVAERAAQAHRRRIRRRSAVAGLAAVIVAGVLVVANPFATPDRSSQVSVTDDAEPAPTPPTSTTTTPTPTAPPSTSATTASPTTTAPATTGPMTSAPATTAGTVPPGDDPPLVSLVDGVTATSTTTSSWEDGYCVEIRVENTTAAPVEWKVRYALGGTIATLWSAVADDRESSTVVFTGEEGYNRQLAPGAHTTFGTCIDR